MKGHSMDRVEICRADGDTDTAKLKLEKLVFLIMCIYNLYMWGVSAPFCKRCIGFGCDDF